MSNQNGLKQQGMALFQVLLMVAIISVLLIIMSQQTQSSVARAQAMQEQVEEQLALSSSAAYVDSLLLSNEWLSARLDETNPLYQLHFYGADFVLELPKREAYRRLNHQVTLQLQNERSLLDINFRTADVEKLIIEQGIEPAQAALMITELQDYLWQPEQLMVQNLSDLTHLQSWDLATIDQLRPYVSTNAPIFNPIWMPDALLPILLSDSQADTIRTLRKNNEITAGLIQQFSTENDVVDSGVFPGISQRVRLISEQSGLQLYREVDYRPRHPSPLRLHAWYFRQEQR